MNTFETRLNLMDKFLVAFVINKLNVFDVLMLTIKNLNSLYVDSYLNLLHTHIVHTVI